MFLHIGAEMDVPVDQVICIADISASDSAPTRDFVRRKKEEGRYKAVVPGHEKSLVITSSDCYVSPISSFTLQKRLQRLISYKFHSEARESFTHGS